MISFNDVSFQYNDKSGVSHLNLHIKKGECVVFAGESGCGKTTVTRLINGLAPYFYHGTYCGNINIMGKTNTELQPENLAGSIGSVFQNPRSQFFNLDTDSEVAFTAENISMPPEKIIHNMKNAVQALDIKHLMGRNILKLSGGEKQLVAIGSVMIPEPEIYVLDEPSANLDALSIYELAKVLKQLKQMGKTIVIAEHRLYYLMDIADRFIYMDKGSIKNQWSIQEFANLSKKQLHTFCLRAPFLHKLLPSESLQSSKENCTLKVENISFAYNKNEPLLKNFSCTLSSGEAIGLIGANGQGKSTFSKILCGLVHEKSGSVLWNEKAITARKRQSLSYLVMQEPGYQLFTESVKQEMSMTATSPSENQIHEMLDFLRLSNSLEKHPLSLSGGEKQRLSIGVAMMQDRDIVIMDEPTSGLDYANMLKVGELIENLRKQGKIVIIISHDYEFILQTCTRILHMDNGSIFRDYMLNNKNLYLLRDFFVPKEKK